MQLTVPDEIANQAEVHAGELKLMLALKLYEDNRIDFASACRLAGISRTDFSRELLRVGLSVQQYPAIRTFHSRRRPAS